MSARRPRSHCWDRRRAEWLRSIHVAVAVLGLLLCLVRTSAAETKPDQGPRLRVPATDSRPVVDGKLGEPCWKEAAKTGPLTVTQGKPTKSTTEAFLIRRSGMSGPETHCWQGTFAGPGEGGLLTGIPARESLPKPDYVKLDRLYRPPG